jgi:preprotein translocase subunit SecA
MREVERIMLLRSVDTHWMDHIDAMDQLREGIGLRGIGQQDPAVAYAQEGFEMFDEMVNDIHEETVRYCYNITILTQDKRHKAVEEKEAKQKHTETSKDKTEPPKPHRRETPKVGRNDPCPCGSGKKYKHCCGKNI